MSTLNTSPATFVSIPDLEQLINVLEVNFVGLAHCSVGTGYRLELGESDAPGIHYNLSGKGKLFIAGEPSVELKPHTLVIIPKNTPFRIEASDEQQRSSALKTVYGQSTRQPTNGVGRFAAGDDDPEVMLICGYFHASYGSAADLFESLTKPIVEQFETDDHIDTKLKSAISELMSQELGARAMSAALLKQVIVAILRRSLSSLDLWMERFSMLGDRQISKAFSEMVANPGARHSVNSLADLAYMSRSAFMAKFSEVFGTPPMSMLRELRMKLAAQQLKVTKNSIEQIAHQSGYDNSGGFIKAFRKSHGTDPTTYRSTLNFQ